jgi:hypothetical protein
VEIVQWVAESMHPFKIVDNHGFQCLMKTGRPDYYLPSAQTVSCDVKQIFMSCQKQIANMLHVCNLDQLLWAGHKINIPRSMTEH